MPEPERPQAEDLGDFVRRVRDGDHAAFAAIHESTIRLVRGVVGSIVRNAADAEEIVADVYHQLWRDVGRYVGGRATLAGWLTVIARSRSIDFERSSLRRHVRRLAPLDALDAAESAQGPRGSLDALERSCQMRQARRAVGRLPRRQRRLIELAFLLGHSHRQIAARTGMALGTVKSHIQRGVVALRLELE